MDRAPYRAPATNRPQPQNQPTPATPTPQQSRAFEPPPANQKPGISKKLLLVVLAVILLLGGLLAAWKVYGGSSSLIKKDKYQAVFLTNGQVYFGKLNKVDGEYFRLNDIYYLQVSEDLQAADPAAKEGEAAKPSGSTPQLIKLGKEIHGPEDEMVLNETQILFFENLTDEGTVGQAIKTDKEKQKP